MWAQLLQLFDKEILEPHRLTLVPCIVLEESLLTHFGGGHSSSRATAQAKTLEGGRVGFKGKTSGPWLPELNQRHAGEWTNPRSGMYWCSSTVLTGALSRHSI